MNNRQKRSRWGRNWYIFLIALFLLGLWLGTFLSRWAPTPEEQSPSASQSPSEAPVPSPPESPPASPAETSSETPSEMPSAKPPTLAQETLESMTLREKVCQMLIVFPSDLTGEEKVTQAGESTRQGLERLPVAGVLYDASSMVSQDQVRELLAATQGYSKVPLLLTCDEEGGRVARLMSTVGTTKIGPMLDYAHLGPDAARANAETIARDMAACGFNADLAPVADVWSNPDNTVIGDRAYSRDFAQATTLIPAAVEGFHAGGVACALKHFPGHGDTAEDSHTGAAYVDKTLDQLRQEELQPFRAGVNAGADMVMLGHLTVPALDSEPAPFSYKIVTELLREELGFYGVAITDSLRMRAVTDRYSSGEAAVRAVQAGVDVLLCPEDPEAAAEALLDAVGNGELTEERIDESVLRVLELKEQRGLL